MRPAPDQDVRDRAIHTHDENLVVLASAGTGKTSLLVEHLLSLIVEQGIPPSGLLAITFTERAAAEMLERLRGALTALSEADPEGRSDEAERAAPLLAARLGAHGVRERAREALGDLPLATISTIHAFCARLLRQHGAALGLPSDFRADEGFAYDELRRRHWAAFLDGPDGPRGPGSAAWIEALEHFDLGDLRGLAFGISGFGMPPLDGDPPLPDPRVVLAERVERSISLAERALTGRAEGGPGRAPAGPDRTRGLGSYLEAALECLRGFAREGPEGLRDAIEANPFRTRSGESRSVISDRATPTLGDFPGASEVASNLRRELRRLAEIDDEAIGCALRVLAPFSRSLRTRAVREGSLPFDALLTLSRDLLLARPDLRRRIAGRFRKIVIDEFQDTNPLQYEIVFLLAESRSSPGAASAFETRLEPGRLFIVGDPKQSIFGFQGADVVACRRAIDHVLDCGGRALDLTATFRSPPALVDPLDALFSHLFRARSDEDPRWSPAYTRVRSGRAGGGSGCGIEVWTLSPPTGRRWKAGDAREAEGRAIARWIAEACEGGGGSVPLGDVAILLRSLTQVHLYTRALREAGIPYRLDRSRSPLDPIETRHFWALLRAVAVPTDAVAVLAVLRSPLGAVSDAELARYAQAGGGAWCYTETRPDAGRFPGVGDAFAWLRDLRDRAATLPADACVTGLLERSRLVPIHAASLEGSARVANLRGIAGAVAHLARADPGLPLRRVLAALEARMHDGSLRTIPGGQPGRDAVEILTIHSAKGLEFPVVFVGDLASDPGDGRRRRSDPVAGWSGERDGPWVRSGPRASALALEAEDEEARREVAEARRLFYVACTRARDRLFLIHGVRSGARGGDWLEALEAWGYDPTAGEGPLAREPAVHHRRPGGEAPRPVRRDRPVPAERAESARRARVASERAIAAVGEGLRRPSGLRESEDARLEAIDDRTTPAAARARAQGEHARAVGIAVHDVLERCDFLDPASPGRLAEAAARRAARATGADADEIGRDATALLERIVGSGTWKDLASVEVVGREVPFLVEWNGERWSGTIDLVYRDRSGRLVVADYKTDRDPPTDPPDPYRQQLAVYAHAVARAFDVPAVEREIVWVSTGVRQRLE